MTSDPNRTWSFPPTVNRILEGKKACKRFVYFLDYHLFTYVYKPAHNPAYLPSTGRAESGLLGQIRLVLCLEKIASPKASCWLFQNLKNKGI